MFIVLLKFSVNKGQANQFMDEHKVWIKRGIDDGVFSSWQSSAEFGWRDNRS